MHPQKIVRVGNSLAITIPAKMARIFGIHSGSEVNVHYQVDKAKATIIFPGPIQLTFDQLPKDKNLR